MHFDANPNMNDRKSSAVLICNDFAPCTTYTNYRKREKEKYDDPAQSSQSSFYS